jgi:hypothetical protein
MTVTDGLFGQKHGPWKHAIIENIYVNNFAVKRREDRVVYVVGFAFLSSLSLYISLFLFFLSTLPISPLCL